MGKGWFPFAFSWLLLTCVWWSQRQDSLQCWLKGAFCPSRVYMIRNRFRDSDKMLQIRMISGERVADVSGEEVEKLRDVRDLMQRLNRLHGFPPRSGRGFSTAARIWRRRPCCVHPWTWISWCCHSPTVAIATGRPSNRGFEGLADRG